MNAYQMFYRAFTWRNLPQTSAINTCEGTKAQWTFLSREGLVKQTAKRGCLGHPFCYALTPRGEDRIREMVREFQAETYRQLMGGAK